MYGRGYRIPGPIRLVMLLFFASIWVPMGLMFSSAGINPFWGDPGEQLRRHEQRAERAHVEAARPRPTSHEPVKRRQAKERHADGAFYHDEHPGLAKAASHTDGGNLWMWALLAVGSLLTAMGAMAAAVWTFLYPDAAKDPEELLEEALRS